MVGNDREVSQNWSDLRLSCHHNTAHSDKMSDNFDNKRPHAKRPDEVSAGLQIVFPASRGVMTVTLTDSGHFAC